MEITRLEIHQVDASHRGNWIFVQLHTDAGVSGVGEASQSGNDGLVVAALEQLGPKIVGADPTQVEVLWERMAWGGRDFFGGCGAYWGHGVECGGSGLVGFGGEGVGGAGLAVDGGEAAR